jgi:hypothetical protein
MGRVADLLGAARRSRRRMMKLREPRTGDMLLYSWLVVVIFVRFTLNCTLALRQLTRGDHVVGAALAEFTFLHLLLIVVLLTFLSSTLSLGADALDRRRLTLLGVPFGTRLAAELAGLAQHPMTGVVLLFLIPALLPACAMPQAILVVVALLIAFVGALLGASALGHALSSSRMAHRIGGGFRFLFAAVMLGLVAANFDFRWADGDVRLLVFQTRLLLDDGAGAGLLPAMGAWSPSFWIQKGWIAPCIGLLTVCLGCYVLALRGDYAASNAPSSSKRIAAPGKAAQSTDVRTLLRHRELRQLSRAPGSFLQIAAGVGACVWLLSTTEPTIGISLLGCALIMLLGFAAASNIFGADGHALNRYALLNVDWRLIFDAKNRAWLIVAGCAMVPACAAAFIRVGPAPAASLLLSAALSLSLCVLWGNISSMLFPSAQGARQGGAFVNQLAPFVIAALPLVIHRTVAEFGSIGFDATVAVCLAVTLVLHVRLRARVARTFDAELESVIERF